MTFYALRICKKGTSKLKKENPENKKIPQVTRLSRGGIYRLSLPLYVYLSIHQ